MNKYEQLLSDVSEMKKFLIGSEFDKKNCLSTRFDSVENKVCLMQNQINTLMIDREKNKNKLSVKIPKWVTILTGIFIKTKTGI